MDTQDVYDPVYPVILSKSYVAVIANDSAEKGRIAALRPGGYTRLTG